FSRDWSSDVCSSDLVKNVLTGDFGRSIRSRRPVIDEIRTRIGPTVELAVGSMAVAVLLGVTTGILSAVRPNSWVDAVSMFIALRSEERRVGKECGCR